jgi:hypothetical protein
MYVCLCVSMCAEKQHVRMWADALCTYICRCRCIYVFRGICVYTYPSYTFHTYRQTDIQTYRHTDIQTYRHADIHTHIHPYIPPIHPHGHCSNAVEIGYTVKVSYSVYALPVGPAVHSQTVKDAARMLFGPAPVKFVVGRGQQPSCVEEAVLGKG